MEYFHSWSGGKDSTASVILDHIHGLPPSTVVFVEVMFDNKRGISGELPEHIDFIHNVAKPKFESWGYKVEILHPKRDYLENFFLKKTEKSKNAGKIRGFAFDGACDIQGSQKITPLNTYFRAHKDAIQYVGIAADEPERLKRLEGTNKISLLARYGYTEAMCYDLCKKYGLLSPIYKFSRRNGCWFCPNAKIRQFAHIKQNHPELWHELALLAKVPNTVRRYFKRNETFQEVDAKVDIFLQNQKNQVSFDFDD